MKRKIHLFCILVLIFALSIYESVVAATVDPLPSWNEGKAKNAIINFIKTTTNKNDPHYVSPENRVATFDQDGTLWVEQPMYTQIMFALDRIIDLAPKHPEWQTQDPFKSVIAKDKAAMSKFTTQDIDKIILATHTGMTTDIFQEVVKDWLKKSMHPRWHRPYTELIYQPMLEVLDFFRANGYKTYIVTGAGQDFVRAYSKKVYAIVPSQIIGSAFKLQYEYDKKGHGQLIQMPDILINNNFKGKPETIFLFIGHQPQAAFGNSTGDQQMLEYTQTNKQARLMMLVSHDDEEREYSYGANSKIGTFSSALRSEANRKGWYVISMKKDWKRIFPFES